MKIGDLIKCFEDYAPLLYQDSYDNAGLIIGNINDSTKKVLIALDCTEEVLEEAIEKKCDLIVTHHPLIFQGIKKINGNNYIERIIIKAIKNNIAIYSAHTNLDNIINGVNFKIASKIGLNNCKILKQEKGVLKKIVVYVPENDADKVREAIFDAGGGNIGNYDNCSYNTLGFGTFKGSETSNPYVGQKGEMHKEKEIKIETIFHKDKEDKIIKNIIKAHPYEEVAYDIYSLDNKCSTIGAGIIGELDKKIKVFDFLKEVKEIFNIPVIKHTDCENKTIKTVALCGGSGSFLINDAIKQKADIFLTSDIKYHQFFDAEQKIILADIGHFESEFYTKDLMFEIINKKFPTFAILLSEIKTNPINYF